MNQPDLQPSPSSTPQRSPAAFWRVVVIVILFFAGWTLVRAFGSHHAKQALDNLSLTLLALSVALHVGSVLCKGALWFVVLRATPGMNKIRLNAVYNPLFIGFLVNALLVARAGELVRTWLLRNRLQESEPEGNDVTSASVLGTVVMEQFLLSIGFCIFLLVSLPFVPLPAWLGNAFYVLIGLVVIGGASVFVIEHRRKMLWI